MDRFKLISAFVQVAEQGSFSAAEKSLGTTQPSVTRAVAQLEASLNTRLFNRTTRTMSLTATGSVYYERMKSLLGALSDAAEEVGAAQSTVRGPLRVTTSALTASNLVIPALVAFKAEFPDITIEVTMDDRRIDPVEQSTDIAVRVGEQPDSTLRVRRAGLASIGLFASPAYLARRRIDFDQPGQIVELEVIDAPNGWVSSLLSARSIAQKQTTSLTVSNVPLARESALAGAGIAVLPHFIVRGDVRDGLLTQVFADVVLPGFDVNVVHPFSQSPPKRVAAFVEFAIGYWRKQGLLAA